MRLHVKDLQRNTVQIASKDREALAGIRQQLDASGFTVSEIKPMDGPVEGMLYFQARSENSGEVRKFLTEQEDVELHDF